MTQPQRVNRSRSQRLAKRLLEDRARARDRKAATKGGNSTRPPNPEFEPFSVRRWRVVAPPGGGPCHLSRAMKQVGAGFRIRCACCDDEFTSLTTTQAEASPFDAAGISPWPSGAAISMKRGSRTCRA
jgi:hypothetical protein